MLEWKIKNLEYYQHKSHNLKLSCVKKLNLNVIGLMAIPPNDGKEEKHF